MGPEEQKRTQQQEMDRRKKERAAKMKINKEVEETIKLETDKNYQMASNMLEESQKKASLAKLAVQNDLSKQKSTIKLRIAQR